MSAIRPSMSTLVSTTIVGVAGSAAPRPVGVGRRTGRSPRPRAMRSLALRDRQAHHPEAEEERDPERQPRAERRRERPRAAGRAAGPSAGRAAGPPRPSTNSAVDSSWTRSISQPRRHDREVRQDREADDDPGDRPTRRAERRRMTAAPPKQTGSPRCGQREADDRRRGPRRGGGCCGSRHSSIDPLATGDGRPRASRSSLARVD